MCSFFDIGKLAAPIDTLVKSFAGAGYLIYEPTRIRRRAKADVEASQIIALGEIETESLVQRAKAREALRLEREQENVEAIGSMAFEKLQQKALPEKTVVEELDNDWLALFIDKARLISDEEVQEAWARILADEVVVPGSFSKQTLNCLANMEKKDAELFQTICSFSFTYNERHFPCFFGAKYPIYAPLGLSFGGLQQLESLGLVTVVFSVLGGPVTLGPLPKRIELSYFGRKILVEFQKEEDNSLRHGFARFTRVGQELWSICEPERDEEFVDFLCGVWAENKELEISLVD